MKLRLDPWPADYEAPIQLDDDAPAIGATVDHTVESATWHAIAPEPATATACYFVDGVRRVEARVMGSFDGILTHGLMGSLSAGFVKAEGPRARFGDIIVNRYLILGKGQRETMLDYAPHSTTDNTPNAVLGELQSLMRTAETRMAEHAAGKGGCVFVDGPSYRATGAQDVVGVIKRIFEAYVSDDRFALVETLRRGGRTPLFSIADGVYDRYSCFLRLADPRPIDHPLAGIVRVEIGAAVGLQRARELASLAASLLPRFASTSQRDPRAPQNLLPGGALEQEMRRRLGDPVLLRRGIEKSLHEQRDR
ncbi:MAG: hypothetical protein HY820_22900 [Acidobacteria bacterium]|nr:hypothetical protein [Acidobacteriota bacterium]